MKSFVCFCGTLLAAATLISAAPAPAPVKKNCKCDNCKCTPEKHCGCYSKAGCKCSPNACQCGDNCRCGENGNKCE